MGYDPLRGQAANQFDHPLEKQPRLAILREETPEELRELGDKAKVINEEREIAERQVRIERGNRKQKDDARAKVDRTGTDRMSSWVISRSLSMAERRMFPRLL